MKKLYLSETTPSSGEVRLYDNPYHEEIKQRVSGTENHARKGRFFIKQDFLYRYPDLVQKVLANMVIWRAECLGMQEVIQYDATSPLFEPVELGDKVPDYNITIVDNKVTAVQKESVST